MTTGPDMPSGVHEALWQMFKNARSGTAIWCARPRGNGLSIKAWLTAPLGFNFLTAAGVEMAVSLDMNRRKERA